MVRDSETLKAQSQAESAKKDPSLHKPQGWGTGRGAERRTHPSQEPRRVGHPPGSLITRSRWIVSVSARGGLLFNRICHV